MCPACQEANPKATACFGAEGPASVPTHVVPCEDHRDDECPNCRGDGKAARFDCPRRLRVEWADDVLRLYGMLREHGQLPDRGGIFDQSAWLMACFRLIDGVVREANHAPGK